MRQRVWFASLQLSVADLIQVFKRMGKGAAILNSMVMSPKRLAIEIAATNKTRRCGLRVDSESAMGAIESTIGGLCLCSCG
jgi:hypothetical protein